MTDSKLDEVLTLLGIGWWNVIHYVVHFFCLSLPVYHALGGAFLAPNVRYSCVPAFDEEPTLENEFIQLHKNYSENYHNGSFMNECEYSIENEATGEIREETCSRWIFDNSTYITTVTSEFQLICGYAYLRATYQSMYMVGMCIGAIVGGFAADRYGRKTTIVVGLLCFIVISNVSCWVPNLTSLLICRFLMGVTALFYGKTSYVLVMETTKPSLRTFLGFALVLPWSIAMILWGGVAYFIRQWRWLQFAVSLPGFLVIPLLWFTDESPRWLAVTGRPERALNVFKKAARLNKKTLPSDEEMMSILQTNRQEREELRHNQEATGIKDKICSSLDSVSILFRITLIFYATYFIANMGYYGLSLSGGNISDNPFLYVVLSGLMEMPAYTLMAPIVARYGRKRPGIILFVLTGVAMLVIVPTPTHYSWVIISLALLGKLTLTAAYQILIFYSTELFPTEVRSRGVGTSFMMSRIGSIISPFINDMLGLIYPWAPSTVFGVTSIIASIAIMMLPEWSGTSLPETVSELERRGRHKDEYDSRRSWSAVPTSEEVMNT